MNKLSIAAMQKKMHSKGTTPAMKKKLVFAMNARKWKKENGGLVEYPDGGEIFAGAGVFNENTTLGYTNNISSMGGGMSAGQIQGLSAVGGMVGQGIDMIDSADGKTSIGGQALAGAAKGAATGLALGTIVPGLGNAAGAAIGGAIGGGIGAVKGVINKRKYEEEAAANLEKRLGSIQSNQLMSNLGGSNRPTFAKGGMISGQPNVELEKEEVSQAPDGSMQKFNLPSHANATSANQMAMEPGTRIFSDKLKAQSGKTIAEEADRLRKEIQRYEQILNS
jgi:hypothetical protein